MCVMLDKNPFVISGFQKCCSAGLIIDDPGIAAAEFTETQSCCPTVKSDGFIFYENILEMYSRDPGSITADQRGSVTAGAVNMADIQQQFGIRAIFHKIIHFLLALDPVAQMVVQCRIHPGTFGGSGKFIGSAAENFDRFPAIVSGNLDPDIGFAESSRPPYTTVS